ncbi:MAG: hypothetical protein ABI068_13270 [Ktedonobacterales bacterium]
MLREEDLLTQPPHSPDASDASHRAGGERHPVHGGSSHVAHTSTVTQEPEKATSRVSQRERMAALSRPIVLSRAVATEAPSHSSRMPRQRAASMARPVTAPLPPHNRRRHLDGMTLLSALLVVALLLTSAGIAYAFLAQHGVVILPSLSRSSGPATHAATAPGGQRYQGTATTPAGKAGTVTVTFTPATRAFTSSGAMTACPSGCDVTATVGSTQRTLTTTITATGQLSYYAVDLQLTAPANYDGLLAPAGKGSNSCVNGPFHLTMSAGQSRWIQCQPANLPVAPDDFYAQTYTPITYQNPKGSYLDTGSHFVTATDCAHAISAASGQAQSWGQSYAPAKQQVVARTAQLNGSWCTPDISHAATTLTGNATITVSYESFAPPDASALASQRLNTLLPSGYAWKQGSAGACTPTWSTPTNSTTFTVTCSMSGLAVAQWTTTTKAQLAAALAGHTLPDALAACNAFAGVQPGSCHISPSDNPAAALPTSASGISIAPAAIH